MSAAPWYRERAAHLMGKSRAGTSARRRAEILAREARRAQRAGVGVGEAVAQDELTPTLWRRVMAKDLHWGLKAVFILAAATVLAVGGAGALLGRWIYEAVVKWVSPRLGRLIWWPWAVAAAAMLIARWVLTEWPKVGLGVGRYIPGSFTGGWAAWAQWQLVVALATVAFMIWAWGWAAVPKGAIAPPEKNKDGSFYVPKTKHKLAPDEDEPVEPVASNEPAAPKREIPLVKLSVDDEEEGLPPADLPPSPDSSNNEEGDR